MSRILRISRSEMRLTTLIIFCCLHNILFSQNKQIDSLSAILRTAKEDTIKVHISNSISNEFFQLGKLPEAKKYAEDALALAEKIDFKLGIKNSYNNLGNIYHRQGSIYHGQGNFPEALKNYFEALKMREKAGDKSKLAKTYGNIGLIYWAQYNYAEALKNHMISLKIFQEMNDKTGIAGTYNNIGIVYETQGNHEEALKNYFAAIKLYEETGDKESMINRYFNIGFLYDDEGKYDEALKNHFEALKISLEIRDSSGIAAAYSNIADIYLHKGIALADREKKQQLFDKSLNNYSIASKIYEEIDEKGGLAVCYTGLGEVHFELKNFFQARSFVMNSLVLSKELGMIENIKSNYQLLTRIDSATGNWKNAFINQANYIVYRDSILNQENTKKTIRAQLQYEFDKKEDSLHYKQALTDEKLKQQTLLTRQQKQTKNYLIVAIVLFAVLSFFIYRNYRNRQRLKLQTLRNKIASDLHDDVGSTLSSISIFSQMAQHQSKETIPLLETIGESSSKMLDAMADIVWTINPENDQFENIILRMKSFAFELLGAKKIDFEFIADDDVSNMKLPMNIRKNLYLIFKEATNNMAKYSGADRAMFTIERKKNNLTMMIRDNGKGFDTVQSKEGNGLINMKKRAREIGAQFNIDSKPGNGTTIQLRLAV